MKKFSLMLTMSFSFALHAQQQSLMNQTWYLSELKIENNTYFPPNNEEVSPEQINVIFHENEILISSGCNQMS